MCGGDNLKRPKDLGGEKEVSCVLRIRLKKSEKDFLDSIAAAGRMGSARSKPTISPVVVTLVRLAWHCLAEHAETHYEPERISEAQALEAGLSLPGLSKRPPTVNFRPVNLWKPPIKGKS
jgi:hypothetical protein